jgi:CubicO group peptidase (beta-lactamase class C family)
MRFYQQLLTLILLWVIALPLDAATLSFIYAGDSDKPIAGVKVTQTESDGTVTIYASDAAGEVTLPNTTNTYTLDASLAETGTDPISVQDALYILQHIVELRTLDTEQIKAADVNSDGNLTIQDALKVLQHNVELTTLNQSLIFLDKNTGEALSETTFSPGDTPSITVVRLGDANQSFDPGSINQGNLDSTSPESVGLTSTKLYSAFDHALADLTYTQSVVVMQNGKYVLEKYRGIRPNEAAVIDTSSWLNVSMYENRNQDSLATTWSTGKSFTSILIGIAIDEGHIASLNESASTYITEWANDDRSKVTIRNLLDMRSGLEPMCGGSDSTELYKCTVLSNGGVFVYADNQNAQCITRDLAETGVKHSWYYDQYQPDATFEEGYKLYSNCDTQNLGEIIFRATGKTLQQYGDEKLFSKIGMKAYWWKDNENNGQNNGNYLAYCCIDATPRDFAKFGQLILNMGTWNGEQIVSREYIQKIKDITTDSIVAEKYGGVYSYGLKFWSLFSRVQEDGITYPENNSLITTIGHDGQYIVIDFEKNRVVVRNSLYHPVLDWAPVRKMKLHSSGSNYPATIPSATGFGSSPFPNGGIQKLLYGIIQAENNDFTN